MNTAWIVIAAVTGALALGTGGLGLAMIWIGAGKQDSWTATHHAAVRTAASDNPISLIVKALIDLLKRAFQIIFSRSKVPPGQRTEAMGLLLVVLSVLLMIACFVSVAMASSDSGDAATTTPTPTPSASATASPTP